MRKILVGMSGGVDSSAAALVLQKEGFAVEGCTLLLCPWANEHSAEVNDARAVCDALGIKHHCVDMRGQFDRLIMEDFCSEYRRGRTPNPCVQCNKYIKFGAMLDWALENGFDGIATGHYAKISHNGGTYELRRADSAKDQSYVLWQLGQKQLEHTLFPLCDREKDELRQMAKDAQLPVFAKKDSQDICFVPDGDYASFIKERTADGGEGVFSAGDFVDSEGNVIGRHKGIIHYTVGQRKGLGGGFSQPMFVLRILPESNRIVLGGAQERFSTRLVCSDVNIIDLGRDSGTFSAQVKIRYAAPPAQASVTLTEDNRAVVEFEQPQKAVTPGQSAVFYDGDRVIGGGFIM